MPQNRFNLRRKRAALNRPLHGLHARLFEKAELGKLEVTICDLHRLNQNLLHFIKRNLILAPVVKLRRPGRLMVGDVLRGFERALVLQVGGDACCAEGVVSDPGLDAGVGRAALFMLPRSTASVTLNSWFVQQRR